VKEDGLTCETCLVRRERAGRGPVTAVARFVGLQGGSVELMEAATIRTEYGRPDGPVTVIAEFAPWVVLSSDTYDVFVDWYKGDMQLTSVDAGRYTMMAGNSISIQPARCITT
jgi:hypothetical protein